MTSLIGLTVISATFFVTSAIPRTNGSGYAEKAVRPRRRSATFMLADDIYAAIARFSDHLKPFLGVDDACRLSIGLHDGQASADVVPRLSPRAGAAA